MRELQVGNRCGSGSGPANRAGLRTVHWATSGWGSGGYGRPLRKQGEWIGNGQLGRAVSVWAGHTGKTKVGG